MEEIKHEVNDDDDEHTNDKRIDVFEEYMDIVIEIDEKMFKFISSFKIGSFLSLDVLVGLSDKYDCNSNCGALFYSKSLFEEHKEIHGTAIEQVKDKELKSETEQVIGKEGEIERNPVDSKNCDGDSNNDNKLDDLDMAVDDFMEEKKDEEHTLIKQIKRKHERFKYSCDKCDHKTTSRKALRWHILKIHVKNPFSCDQCTFVGSNHPFLTSHKNKIHNGVRYDCDLCDHVSYCESLVKLHIKQYHANHAYEPSKTTFNVEDYSRCQPCNKLFQTERRYLEHVSEKHSSAGGPKKVVWRKRRVKCPTCANEFPSERRVEMHIIKSHDTLMQCTKCDEKFSDRKLFIEHRNSHRQKLFERHINLSNSSVFMCSTCGKSFTEKKVYLAHMKWHRYDTPTACEVCGKEMKRSSMGKHKRTHNSHDHKGETQSENNFCDICGKGFYGKGSLTAHIKKHNNQKDILCTYEGCTKAFYTIGHMKDHVRVHTGQAIRQCETCGKDFKSMSAYRYHTRRIHPVADSNADVQNTSIKCTPNLSNH